MLKTLVLLFSVICASVVYSQASFYRLFGGDQFDYGYDIVEMPDSGFLITGMSGSFNEGHADAFLLRLDKSGNYLWSAPYGGSENQGAFELEAIPNVGVYLIGRTNSFSGDYDSWVSFVSETGTVLWEKAYSGPNWEEAVDGSLTLDSGLILGVHAFGNDTQDQDIAILRLDKHGDTVWTQEFTAPGFDEITNVEPYQDSLFVLSSFHLDTATNYRYSFLRMFHEDGALVWDDTVGIYPIYTRLSDFFIRNDTLFGVGENIDDDTLNGDIYRLLYRISPGNNGAIANISSSSGDYFVADVITNVENPSIVYTSLRFLGEFTQSPGSDVYLYAGYSNGLVFFSNVGYTQTAGEDKMLEAIPTSDGGAVYVGFQSTGFGGTNLAVAKIGPNFDYPTIQDVTFVNQLVNTNELLSMKHIAIYPNPSSSIVKIETPKGNVNSYKLLSTKGDMIKEGKLQGLETVISVHGIEDGMYLLQLYQNENFLGAERLLIR